MEINACFSPSIIIISVLTPLLIMFFLTRNQLRRRNAKPMNLPPSPPSLPLLGHLHLIKEPIHRTLQSISEAHGKTLLLRVGSRKILLLSSPSAVEECFTKNDVAFSSRPMAMATKHFHYHYTTILAAPYGDLWRSLRRFMTLELFSSASIAKFAPVREAEVRSWARRIATCCGGDGGGGNIWGKIEMKGKISELMFDIMTVITLGERFYGEGAKDGGAAGRKFEESVKAGVKLSGAFNLADFFPVLRWMDLIGIEKKMVGLMAKMDGFFQDIVDDHRRRRRHGDGNGEKKAVIIEEILDLQRRQPEVFTDDIVKGILLVILTAGTETSATTLEWALALLLNHPNSMAKLRAEIDTKIGQDRFITEQDLPNLTYLQNVINETHRLYPAVPLLTLREASDDCVVSGYDVAKGTILMINAWAIHRDPELWDDPTSFRPERFEGGGGGDQGWKLIPFGGGRRRCPGSVVANREVGLALGCLVQLFDWKKKKEGTTMIDMREALGLTMPRASPVLDLFCKPRQAAMKLLL